MKVERLELGGLDWARYFVPTAICLYLSGMCLVLVVTSTFLVTLQNAVAVTASGLFGVLLTAGLGLLFWNAQRRELQYLQAATPYDPASNFVAVKAAVTAAGWRILREEPGQRLDAQTSVLLLNVGERVAVRFRGADVLVASICDPSVGFSLVGRRHCAEHRQLVQRAALRQAQFDG